MGVPDHTEKRQNEILVNISEAYLYKQTQHTADGRTWIMACSIRGLNEKDSVIVRWEKSKALCDDNGHLSMMQRCVSPAGVWSPSGKTWGLLRSSVPAEWTWAWPADWLLYNAQCSGGWTYCRGRNTTGKRKVYQKWLCWLSLTDRILFAIFHSTALG